MSNSYIFYKNIRLIPMNNVKVKNIVSLVRNPSSPLENKRENKGDVLKRVQPMPIGRVLKTSC